MDARTLVDRRVGLPLVCVGAFAVVATIRPAAASTEPDPLLESTPSLQGDVEDDMEWLGEPLGAQPARSADADGPNVLFLWYSDGGVAPLTGTREERKTWCDLSKPVPKFECKFGSSVQDCQRKIQAVLDRNYADFNLVFALTKPTSGAFKSMTITTAGAGYCDAQKAANGAWGTSLFSCDGYPPPVTSHTFVCDTLYGCATTISHENAHTWGLAHTAQDSGDIMKPRVDGRETEVFKNEAFPMAITNPLECPGRAEQTSYPMLVDRLGRWPGGTKPATPDDGGSGGGADGGGPDGGSNSGGDGGKVPVRPCGNGGDDCMVHGTCTYAVAGPASSASGQGVYFLLAVAIAARLRRSSGR